MSVSFETFNRLVLEDHDHKWELVCGRLVEKKLMTIQHNSSGRRLQWRLRSQLNENEWEVDFGAAHLRVASGTYRIPDVCVIPKDLLRRTQRERPTAMELYDEPLPLVVEIWSPSTGQEDVESKVPEYQQRGDREIWRLHYPSRTLTSWRRQPDGAYTETVYHEGVIEPVALPGVRIDLADLFQAP